MGVSESDVTVMRVLRKMYWSGLGTAETTTGRTCPRPAAGETEFGQEES